MSNRKPSSDRSLAGSVWSSGLGEKHASASKKDDSEKQEPGRGAATQILPHGGVDIEQHRKMMSQILTYVADMHRSLGSSSSSGAEDNNSNKRGGPSFVRRCSNGHGTAHWQSFFYQEARFTAADESDGRLGILFSTQNFRHLQAIEAESSKALFAVPPFNFYAASTTQDQTTASRKRIWSDSFRNPLASASSSDNAASRTSNTDGKTCWFRLTRLTSADIPDPPTLSNPAVRRYLTHWRDNDPELRDIENLRDILTLESLSRTPEITEVNRAQEIRFFIKQYRRYLRKKVYQKAVEPMYIKLFEWVQQTHHNDELVWGLGHARMTNGDQVVNGPLLEILMQVELARDGALLVRPREHTGVAVNREVSALLASNGQRLADLHQAVSELDPTQIAPGEPKTYVPFFKKCAVELSSGGSFHFSSKAPKTSVDGKMIITEAWCLYARSKPGSVWARDAMSFAKQLNVPGGGKALPRATLALTHGPSACDGSQDSLKRDTKGTGSTTGGFLSRLWNEGIFQSTSTESPQADENDEKAKEDAIVFPLPASEAQNKIANMLLHQNYPAVVTEGPPGTGKTHTIANIICASLCHGKRVLITSKGAAALSVIRERLPSSVQDLCVDVSLSESQGMRQLQQTVERLANRVACVSRDTEAQKCHLLSSNIASLKKEQLEINDKLIAASDSKRKLIQQPEGQELVSGSLELIEKAPLLMTGVWPVERLSTFRDELAKLTGQQDNDMNRVVLGFTGAVPRGLLAEVSVKAEVTFASVKLNTKKMLSSMPLLGAAFGSDQDSSIERQLAAITIDGKAPTNTDEWKRVLHVLTFEDAMDKFHSRHLEAMVKLEGWQQEDVYDWVGKQKQQRIIRLTFFDAVKEALRLKQLAVTLEVADELESACRCYALDTRRSQIASQIQSLAEDLVDARVVTQLSETFSAEAQSALIRFSQIAGRAKFSRSAQAANMSARQRRHRKEYLESFDKCVRYIPCWIMTTAQISDYLPAEACLFDLAIIDESSQSDITVLPGMLRGKQWLIVGDSKQVSPTEAFISENSIDNLRAALPICPLQESLMPGQSFFDFAAQAYPRGRIVLREHFRCAPEIINFSNQQYYDGNLVPLRLPTSSERLTPSIIDVRVPNGLKNGKTNEREIEEVVKRIYDFVNDPASTCASKAKSIGVISLQGNEQSKTIRERLLTSIGTKKMYEHDVLVGDPPTFQGNERDIIFLSMVCSPQQVSTQNNMMYAQRMNVALSRARDRMVLVRSVDLADIPNSEDVRVPVIEFFEGASALTDPGALASMASTQQVAGGSRVDTTTFSFRARAESLLEKLLKKRGFSVRRMGVVWNHALCVEHHGSTSRAGLCIENAGETQEEWHRVVMQQKSIERVGWKCLRVDGLSLLMDHQRQFEGVVEFLASAGVEVPVLLYDTLEDEEDDNGLSGRARRRDDDSLSVEQQQQANPMGITEVVEISSDDEDGDRKMPACKPDAVMSHRDATAVSSDHMDAAQFGQVVKVDFYGGMREDESTAESSSVRESASQRSTSPPATSTGSNRKRSPPSRKSSGASASNNDDDSFRSEQSDDEKNARRKAGKKRSADEPAKEAAGAESDSEDDQSSTSSKRRRKASYKKLDKYARDGRFYPDRKEMREEDTKEQTADDWCDTDSDLPANHADADEDEDYEPNAQA